MKKAKNKLGTNETVKFSFGQMMAQMSSIKSRENVAVQNAARKQTYEHILDGRYEWCGIVRFWDVFLEKNCILLLDESTTVSNLTEYLEKRGFHIDDLAAVLKQLKPKGEYQGNVDKGEAPGLKVRAFTMDEFLR